ncbi:hypothetical protein [Methylopila turkensis]|uniref:Uncharacterized protein n=1 Tax=Methylopila turkensis TaxID=1437816 RepID=A0A9W6JQB3_9HYPH|nr:hypothetical protein [Methylopila turkensis]GLK81322.1 hypothetical protein GCM10008174_30630 [Methylopila turkensis]
MEIGGVQRLVLKIAAAGAALLLMQAGSPGGGPVGYGGDVRQFASTEVEGVIRAACVSPDAFVVLDTFRYFRPANLDDDLVDPDRPGSSRIGHGDIVAAIARLSHEKVTPYQIDPVFNARTLARDLARLAGDIERGRIERPAAVISSIVLPVDLEDVNRRLPPDRRVSSRDIAARKAEVLDVIAGGSENNPYRIVRDALATLKRERVPVFVAAGNTGPDTLVNVLGLGEGVYAVGALDAEGRRAAYTSMPDLVALWAPGQFVLTEAEGGVSLNRAAEVAFRGVAMPDEKAVIARFAGRRPEEVALNVPEALTRAPAQMSPRMRRSFVQRILEPGVYRTEDLLTAYGYPRSAGHFVRSLEQGAYMHYPSDMIFRVDRGGRLAFDPLGDGGPGQLAANDATSFAAPNLCASGRSAALARTASRGR